MRRLALLLCLILVSVFTLMPQVSGAAGAPVAQGQGLHSRGHGAAVSAPGCPDCDRAPHEDHGCPTMGAACAATAGCSLAIAGVALPAIAVAVPRDAPLHPALSRVRAQRALMPEPPPPRS